MHLPLEPVVVYRIRFQTMAHKVMRSNPEPTIFIFELENILRSNLNFDFIRLLYRFKVLIVVIISEFNMAWGKKFIKIFTYRTFVHPMSRQCRHRLFSNLTWLIRLRLDESQY